jgi:hypothetical protein
MTTTIALVVLRLAALLGGSKEVSSPFWCEDGIENVDGSFHCTDWDTDYAKGDWAVGPTGNDDELGYLVCPPGSVMVDPQEDTGRQGDSIFCVEVR